EHMENAARLAEASNNLSLALTHMANAICLFDPDERLVLHNERLREIFGTPADIELVGQTFRQICFARYKRETQSDGDAEIYYQAHRKLFTDPAGGEDIRVIANGRTIRTIHRPTGDGSWVTTIEDITERVKSEQQISYLARHDTLTNLPNRRQFVDRLDIAISDVRAGSQRVAAICIDLDNFKDINDTFGHAVGDVVLCTLAQRMSDTRNADELIGRFGGDEFVAFKTFSKDAELQDFIERLMHALTGRIELEHTEMMPGASLGIAIYPTDAADREKLLSNADMAMYRSKESLEDKISFYEAGMDEAARERRAMARDIWTALEQEQFFLTYQVQRSVKTAEITGYEVLLRWRHPIHGLIPPTVFIPIAEECGAISALGDWVLERACHEAANRPLEHKIAVNLSPLQLSNIALVDRVQTILLNSGLPASRLELEVTESAIIGDKARALHILRQIKALGVTIAIDDFGTGYSSLETLRSFPFDKIKLDRSFVSELETSRQSKAFVRAIVALGKSLEVSILAEGVETHEQMRVLVAEGCDEVQGFLFGRPGTLEQLAAPQPRLITNAA
ncbi:MAG: EAL domain-containing protein, partial [Rhizobiaceae bacterium]|nr:EAL domain-containing protein [Rhizobiaceae bacterium]